MEELPMKQVKGEPEAETEKTSANQTPSEKLTVAAEGTRDPKGPLSTAEAFSKWGENLSSDDPDSDTTSTPGLFFEALNSVDSPKKPCSPAASSGGDAEVDGDHGRKDIVDHEDNDERTTRPDDLGPDVETFPLTMKSEPNEDLAADFYITTNDGEMTDGQEGAPGDPDQAPPVADTTEKASGSGQVTSPNQWNKKSSFVSTGKAVVQVPLFYGGEQMDGPKKPSKNVTKTEEADMADEADQDGPVPSLLVELVPGQKKLPLDLRRVHSCTMCDSKFTRKGSLSRHMLTHSAEKPWKCLECGKEFRQKGNLTLHEFTHTGARPYQCPLCDQAFITKTKLQIHESIHREEKPWCCQICGKGFKRDADLRKHLLIHSGEKSFECDLCGKAFLLNSQLKAHKVRHNGEENFKCDQCGRTFLLSSDLKSHVCEPLPIVMKLQRPKRKRKYVKSAEYDYEAAPDLSPLPPKLDILSEKIRKLSKDMKGISQEMKNSEENVSDIKDVAEKSDNDDKTETATRDRCDASTSGAVPMAKCTLAMAAKAVSMATGGQVTVDTLDEASGLLEIGENSTNQNIEVVKKGLNEDKASQYTPTNSDNEADLDKKIDCKICGRQFVHKQTLEKHMLIHTQEKLHKCDICGDAFTHGYSLKEHKINHSLVADGKPYKCKYCEMVFKHASYLKRHESIHTGERPWDCDVCGKSFRTKWHLTSHSKSHSGERPFQCELCGRAFGHRCDLKQHMLVHTGERPYVCEQCGQSFKSSSHYWQHMRRHTGEKRHKCTYDDCDKAFTTPYELQRHLQFHTGDKPWICGVCGKAYIDKAVMLRHERGHTGAKEYSCKICDASFDMKSLLNEHKSVHVENGDVPKRKRKKKPKVNKCFLCGVVFETEVLLEEHKVLHTVLPYNGPEKKFPCGHCNELFADEDILKCHEQTHKYVLESTGTIETLKVSRARVGDEFECMHCHETFPDEMLCKIHELKHEMDRSGTFSHASNPGGNGKGHVPSFAVFPEGVQCESGVVFPQGHIEQDTSSGSPPHSEEEPSSLSPQGHVVQDACQVFVMQPHHTDKHHKLSTISQQGHIVQCSSAPPQGQLETGSAPAPLQMQTKHVSSTVYPQSQIVQDSSQVSTLGQIDQQCPLPLPHSTKQESSSVNPKDQVGQGSSVVLQEGHIRQESSTVSSGGHTEVKSSLVSSSGQIDGDISREIPQAQVR